MSGDPGLLNEFPGEAEPAGCRYCDTKSGFFYNEPELGPCVCVGPPTTTEVPMEPDRDADYAADHMSVIAAMRGEPELPNGSSNLLVVPQMAEAPARDPQYFVDQHDNMVRSLLNTDRFTSEQKASIWAARALFGQPSEHLEGAYMNYPEQVLQHVEAEAKAQLGQQHITQRDAGQASREAKAKAWADWKALCQARKARIATAKATYDEAKEQAKLATAPARTFIAQWDDWLDAQRKALAAANAEPVPPRPQ